MRVAGYLALALSVAVPAGALAVDPPHDQLANCGGCHLGHNAPGGSLTGRAGNANLCQSCHSPVGGGGPSGHGFPWVEEDQAVPGIGGRSHSWSARATNMGATPPRAGASDPGEAAMAAYLDAGSLKCTTCHDAHQADAVVASGRGTLRASPPSKPLGATGTVSVASAPAGIAAKSYVVQITVGGDPGTARFRVSNDRRISWVQENVATGATVTLADGVVLAFGGTAFVPGHEYAFHVSYPFLRADNTASKMCVTCHRDRDQRWQDVKGGGPNGHPGGKLSSVILGTTVFHHPVGQPLDANARGYDRAGGILDVNGQAQSAGDGNASNDLVLDAGGVVHCMTCHGPHNADSNSRTEDE